LVDQAIESPAVCVYRTIIDKVMSMENIVEAHKYVDAGKKRGNLVIKVEHACN